jgi:hypothetical protein
MYRRLLGHTPLQRCEFVVLVPGSWKQDYRLSRQHLGQLKCCLSIKVRSTGLQRGIYSGAVLAPRHEGRSLLSDLANQTLSSPMPPLSFIIYPQGRREERLRQRHRQQRQVQRLIWDLIQLILVHILKVFDHVVGKHFIDIGLGDLIRNVHAVTREVGSWKLATVLVTHRNLKGVNASEAGVGNFSATMAWLRCLNQSEAVGRRS